MKKYTHILFDLDRTLLDFDKGANETLEELYVKFIKPNCSFDKFYNLYKIINASLWDEYRKGNVTKEILRIKRFSKCLEELHIFEPIAGKMADLFVKGTSEKAYLIAHTNDLMIYLKKKYTLGVISNGFHEVQYPRLKKSGLDKFFEYVFISDEIGYNKPDIKLFEYSLSVMNCEAAKTIYVGDDFEVDILGAAKANIDQIFFNPNHTENTHDFKPTWQVSSLDKIMEIL